MTDKDPKGERPATDAHKDAHGDETGIDNTRQNTPGDNHAPLTYRSHYIPSVTCAKGDRGGSVWAIGHTMGLAPFTDVHCDHPTSVAGDFSLWRKLC